jgi:hypothetical protein
LAAKEYVLELTDLDVQKEGTNSGENKKNLDEIVRLDLLA